MEKENFLQVLLEIWHELPELIGNDWPNFYIRIEDLFTLIQSTESSEEKSSLITKLAISFRTYPKAASRLREKMNRLEEQTRGNGEQTNIPRFGLSSLLEKFQQMLTPPLITRYLDITMPHSLLVNRRGVITVGLTHQPTTESDNTGSLELITKQSLEIHLLSKQEDLEVISEQIKYLSIETGIAPEPVVFFIKGSNAGTRELLLEFHQAGTLIKTVKLLINLVEEEALKEQLTVFTDPISLSASSVPPPDLDIRITMENTGTTILNFILHSPNGVTPFHYHQVSSKKIYGSPEEYQHHLIEKIEDLAAGRDTDGNPLSNNQVNNKLISIGRLLYEELFSKEMRSAYRTFRKTVKTIQITSDEPWIPWELIKPYDDSDLSDIIDDDFLCCQFQLTRWLAGSSGPAGRIPVSRAVCVEAGQPPNQTPLRYASAERQYFIDMASICGIEDASPSLATSTSVENLLDIGGSGLWHFAAHGNINLSQANESVICLADGISLKAEDIHGHRQTHIARDKPLVFLNACRVGQQGWSLTRLGGWAATWVDKCRCGAFIGPLWSVDDELAYEFAKTFYDSLRAGKTIGEATKDARKHIRNLDTNNPTWLAYSVYAHPNARLIFNAN
jgi:hypothetical protein